jgi:maleylpyruvate isomerase
MTISHPGSPDQSQPASPSGPPALDALEAATSRYLEALTVLDDEAMRAPSLLPDWSRAHVVTHLARNADGMVNVLTGVRLGEVRALYPSQEQRNADIDSGAGRSAQELRREAEETTAALLEAARALTAEQWDSPVRRTPEAEPFPARAVPAARLLEVEVHHADLGVGYTWERWDGAFADGVITRAQGERSEEPSAVLRSTDTGGLWKIGLGEGPEVSGPAGALAWWLLGRGEGSGLVSSAGTVPTLSRWR